MELNVSNIVSLFTTNNIAGIKELLSSKATDTTGPKTEKEPTTKTVKESSEVCKSFTDLAEKAKIAFSMKKKKEENTKEEEIEADPVDLQNAVQTLVDKFKKVTPTPA